MIKVLIIDDSALVRELLKQIFSRDESIEVVGTAHDPYIAVNKIKKLNPDLVTLDVEMPRMDGLTFLEKLMKAHPLPVVMISSLTEKNCMTTIKALELGAIDFVKKPQKMVSEGMMALGEEIIRKVKNASKANVSMANSKRSTKLNVINIKVPIKYNVNEIIPEKKIKKQTQADGEKTIIIGASTGGVVALLELLKALPEHSPGIVIVQHIPAGFSKAFAERVNSQCKIEVKEAENGDRIRSNKALIAPGGIHMLVQKDIKGFYVQLKDGPPVNRHKPSVDVLFRSAAYCLGEMAIGVILTGMGNDGAVGMLEMKKAGAYNIAQDKKTSIVYGMPKEAVDKGAVDKILPLQDIPGAIMRLWLKNSFEKKSQRTRVCVSAN